MGRLKRKAVYTIGRDEEETRGKMAKMSIDGEVSQEHMNDVT
jgi:hypothetical protein